MLSPTPTGIPSQDTFGPIFTPLDPEQFQKAFFGWVQSMNELTPGQGAAINGKTLHRLQDHRLGQGAIHMISA